MRGEGIGEREEVLSFELGAEEGRSENTGDYLEIRKSGMEMSLCDALNQASRATRRLHRAWNKAARTRKEGRGRSFEFWVLSFGLGAGDVCLIARPRSSSSSSSKTEDRIQNLE